VAITLETLDKPVLASISGTTGGSLTPGDTWYFRVVAIKEGFIESPWMDEASYTLGAGETAITISWNPVPNADHYFVLATQTSGDYDDTVGHVAGYNLTGTTFTWTGSWPSYYYKYFWYRPDGVPNIIIEVWVKRQEAGHNVEYNNGSPRKGLKNTYVVEASMTFGQSADCYFRQYNADILVLGALRFSNAYTKLFQLGYRSGSKMPERGCELRVRGTCNITWAGTCYLYGSDIVAGSCEYSTWNRCPVRSPYSHTWKRMVMFTDPDSTVKMVGCRLHGAWGYLHRKEQGEHSHVVMIGVHGGFRANGLNVSDLTFMQCREGLGMHGCNGENTFRQCVVMYGCLWDVRWGSTPFGVGNPQHLVDCIFNSRNQGQDDHNPYGIWYGYNYIGPNGMLSFEHEFDPVFVDTDGNPLNNYDVILRDKDGFIIISDTTDANGKLSAGSRDVVWRKIRPNSDYNGYLGTGYLSDYIAAGKYFEDVRNPHTLIVSKGGTTYLEATLDIEKRMTGYIIVDTTGEPVYPTIASIDITGDKDNLQIGETYPVQVTVDATGCDKTYYVRCYATCPRGLGVQGFPSDWVQIAPGDTHSFEGTITPAEAGGIDNLAFRIYAAEEIPDELPQIADQMEIDITVAIKGPLLTIPLGLEQGFEAELEAPTEEAELETEAEAKLLLDSPLATSIDFELQGELDDSQ